MQRIVDDLNIIEIGRPYLKYVLPRTRLFASRVTGSSISVNFESLGNLRSALADESLDLIVCHAPIHSLWSRQWWVRSIANKRFLRGYMPITSLIAPHFLRARRSVPLAVVHLDDQRFISMSNLHLLDNATTWFHRELPVDRWQVFMRTGHHSVPTHRYRQHWRHRQRIDKIRPISLGPALGTEQSFPSEPRPKTVDIFFAGRTEGSSTVREHGVAQLKKLQQNGVRIDLPSERLSREAFIQRASAAYLVWSPEGYGWDCFRHYEAPLCWSVPLINQPTVERYQPMLQDVHAAYYFPEGDGLFDAATAALADRERLIRIAAQAQRHVTSYHLMRPLAEYIINCTLDSAVASESLKR